MKRLFNAIIVSIFLCFYGFCFNLIPVVATSITKVTFNDTSAKIGETIEIKVTIADAPKVKSLAVAPVYDSAKLEYVSGEWLLSDALLSDWSDSDENGVMAFSSETSINGNVAKLVFRIKDTPYWEFTSVSANVILKTASSETIPVTITPSKTYMVCEHTWDLEIKTVDSSCTQAGYTYKVCTFCKTTEKVSDIDKKSHLLSDWIVDKEATIYEEGLRHKECRTCETLLEEEVLPLLGECNHKWEDEVLLQEATCLASGSVYKVCKICQEKSKLYDIAKLPHVLGDWVVDKEPTETETGARHKDCTVCKQTVVEETIPEKGACAHSFGEELYMENATCSKEGNVYGICQLCEKQVELYKIDKIPHLSSEWIIDEEPTYEKDGTKHKECTVCEEVLESGTISKLVKEEPETPEGPSDEPSQDTEMQAPETPTLNETVEPKEEGVAPLVVVLIGVGSLFSGGGVVCLIFYLKKKRM